MTIDLDDLEAKANAATQGAWEANPLGGFPNQIREKKNEIHIADCHSLEREIGGDQRSRANAAYIAAAQPSTVLALIARIRELEERIDDLHHMQMERPER